MEIRFRTVLGLSLALFAAACGGSVGNANRTNVNIAAPVPAATATPAVADTDPTRKSRIESELRKKGFDNITIDVTTTPATIRGTYAKGKLAEVVQTAQLADGGKSVNNEATEEK